MSPMLSVTPIPSALMNYQNNWVADMSPLCVVEKSRRTGFTWAEASLDVLTAASSTSANGMNVYYIAYNQDMTIEYIQACAMWAKAFNYAASEIEEGFWSDGEDDKQIKTYTIKFPNSGYRIVALSSRPSNLRGRQGLVVIDEAAFHEQLDELLKAALALLIWGGKVRVISTHNGVENPFNVLINDIRSGKRRGSVHRVTFEDAVKDGLYHRVCLRQKIDWSQAGEDNWVQSVYDFYGDAASEELDCVPKFSSGSWLSAALIEARMSKESTVIRYECEAGFELLADSTRWREVQTWLEQSIQPLIDNIPRTASLFFGQDFGRSGDLSAQVPMIVEQNLTRRIPFILELRNVPFKQQEQILFFILDRLPNFFGGAFDARGNGQYLAEVAMQRYGTSRINQVMFTENWYLEHMPPFKAALEDGMLVDIPMDKDIANDLRTIEVVRGVPRIPDKRSTGVDKGKRHGDTAIAMVLAYFASRMLNKPPVKATSRKPRQSAIITKGYS